MSFQVNNPVIGYCHIGLGPGRVGSGRITGHSSAPKRGSGRIGSQKLTRVQP